MCIAISEEGFSLFFAGGGGQYVSFCLGNITAHMAGGIAEGGKGRDMTTGYFDPVLGFNSSF